jgi:hypothetical protein
MPVKLSSRTNAGTGEILPADVATMKDAFINQVELTPVKGRERIIIKFSVAVMKDALKNLIDHYESNGGIDVVRINFAVHPNSFSACNGTDYSNSLTVVIEAEKFKDLEKPHDGTIPYHNDQDFVVIPGYNGFSLPGFADGDKACCPSTNP